MHKGVGLEIMILSRLIGRKLNGICNQPNEKISGPQGLILAYLLSSEEDVFQKDIEREFDIRRSTATGLLHSLEQQGYIIKEEVNYDARLKKLVVTDKALCISQSITERKKDIELKLIQGLNPEEIDCFFNVVNKMKNNLNKEEKNG
mgnify:FL=1